MMAVVPVPMPAPSAAIPRPEPPRQHPTILDSQSLELSAGRGAKELVELADEHLDAVGEEDVARDLCQAAREGEAVSQKRGSTQGQGCEDKTVSRQDAGRLGRGCDNMPHCD